MDSGLGHSGFYLRRADIFTYKLQSRTQLVRLVSYLICMYEKIFDTFILYYDSAEHTNLVSIDMPTIFNSLL